MPVRIYDIAKKYGLENKEILAKAKSLGIAARVPSSSLDKISAEYLEEHLCKEHPELRRQFTSLSTVKSRSLRQLKKKLSLSPRRRRENQNRQSNPNRRKSSY